MPWKESALAMWKTGMSGRAIARELDMGKSSVNEFLKPHKDMAAVNAKILIFDIETAPIEVYTWSLWPKFIGHDMMIQDWTVLTWSAKWLGEPEMMNDCTNVQDPRDDFNVCESLWQLIDKADIVVAHNGDRFDLKKMNTRFLLHGFPEPSAYRSVDTLKIAKRKFAFTSNRLDFIAKATGGEGKVKHSGFDMWRRCLAGEQAAFDEMIRYNDGDVRELERVYLELRGWDHLHPNISLYSDNDQVRCPNCGSADVEPTGKYAYTQVGQFSTYRCNDCGKISKSRVSAKSKEQKRNIIVPSK